VKGLDGVFVVGDLAAFEQDGAMLPGVAQVAIQGGRRAAENIARLAKGEATLPFHYKDLGSMATVGRSRAIAVVGKLKLTGFIAWLAWLFVHLMALVGFRNRLAVLSEWAWAYLTFDRSARIILDQSAPKFAGGELSPPLSVRSDVLRAALPAKAADGAKTGDGAKVDAPPAAALPGPAPSAPSS